MRLKHNSPLPPSLHKPGHTTYVLQRSKTTISGASAGHLWGLFMLVGYLLSKIRAYLRYRETVRELSLLSDRELDDLGIARYTIPSVARRAATA